MIAGKTWRTWIPLLTVFLSTFKIGQGVYRKEPALSFCDALRHCSDMGGNVPVATNFTYLHEYMTRQTDEVSAAWVLYGAVINKKVIDDAETYCNGTQARDICPAHVLLPEDVHVLKPPLANCTHSSAEMAVCEPSSFIEILIRTFSGNNNVDSFCNGLASDPASLIKCPGKIILRQKTNLVKGSLVGCDVTVPVICDLPDIETTSHVTVRPTVSGLSTASQTASAGGSHLNTTRSSTGTTGGTMSGGNSKAYTTMSGSGTAGGTGSGRGGHLYTTMHGLDTATGNTGSGGGDHQYATMSGLGIVQTGRSGGRNLPLIIGLVVGGLILFVIIIVEIVVLFRMKESRTEKEYTDNNEIMDHTVAESGSSLVTGPGGDPAYLGTCEYIDSVRADVKLD